MKAEIVASGTELLLGEVTDINTPFIANQLSILGIDLYHASIVDDNHERFLDVLKQAQQRSDIVIITGGLGPTKGDITREVIARLMNEQPEVVPELKRDIIDYFARIGIEMPENNLKQATLIPSATAIRNPLGTAPGWWVEKAGRVIISLPGPPSEMQPMWQKEIFPRLKEKGEAIIMSHTLKSWGLSEAKIDQMVGHFMTLPCPTLALYAKSDGIHLRITAKATSKDEAAELIRTREAEIRRILKDNIWGADNDTLEEVISRLIQSRGLSLAAAESFTGGFLSYSLSNAPDSRQFFKGGIIALDKKTRASLKINPDSIEKANLHSASCMAAAARDYFSSDIGIGIDGCVESTNGVYSGKAFIAINVKQSKSEIAQVYPGRNYQLVKRSTMQALFNLRRVLLEMI
jgi:nicotinamide-nucleotide amidase